MNLDLKNISGGYIIPGGASCTANCDNGKTITCSGHTCASEDWDGGGTYAGTCSSKDSGGLVLEWKSC